MKFADIAKHAKEAEAVWGESYDILWPIIKSKKYKVGAEIGVAFGGHSERILQKTKAEVYCIDPYQHFKRYNDPMNKPQEEFDQLYMFTKKRLSIFKEKAILLRNTSKSASKKIIKDLDFIYIDAVHSYKGVLEDLGIWFSKVRVGGILSGHDYNHPDFPGVKKAVDEFFSRFNWKINYHSSGVWWVEKKPLNISYIIPTYNSDKTISESIDSILANFIKGDEIIVVDDCSTDKTKGIISEFIKKNPEIKYIKHKQNKGGGAARNTAIENSKNSLIFCLDSDNILMPNSIDKLKKFLIVKNYEIASFSNLNYFKKNTKEIHHKWEFNKNFYDKSNFLSTIYTPGASGNYLFTKSSWLEAKGYPENSGALDAWGFGLKQIMSGKAMHVLPQSSYYHRLSENSYWNRSMKKKNPSIQATKILLDYYTLLPTSTIKTIMNKKTRESWLDNLDKNPLKLIKAKEKNNNFWKLFTK